ncbi:Bgt-4263 [Blumeria graminis f. sp. tritici]|uniref:Bgt-4263 n=2 Tax=Blumeria graminis f. sp. tritici TaxID=62690 RepID=A0A9X9MEL5_BLUGR|nr:hypothetical protein BGT96224_4263 [Blumeria graminis f. sp. tritici 96224]VDB83646.1 Bgt-4263 [Blumeria graminis f. sp. tritici]
MRLFLIPISTSRTLIYCQRLNLTSAVKESWSDKGTLRAAKLWTDWKDGTNWQKKVVKYGNQLLRKIPFEEWALKSIPPLSSRAEGVRSDKVEVIFPDSVISREDLPEILHKMGSERQRLHRTRMIYSMIGMPISAPVMLIPVYVLFESGWVLTKALSVFLTYRFSISSFAHGLIGEHWQDSPMSVNGPYALKQKSVTPNWNEVILCRRPNIKQVATALNLPELESELSRAVEQVEQSFQSQKTPEKI